MFWKKMTYALAITAALTFASCGGSHSHDSGDAAKTETTTSESSTDPAAADKSGPEYTSKYICPMYCKGSGSDQPGKCPVCGMDYVLNENYQEQDQPGHEGHNH